MDAKFEHLENILRESGRVLIAFSAGVDSTFLLKVAHDTLKERITALTASSASVPPGELAAAKEFPIGSAASTSLSTPTNSTMPHTRKIRLTDVFFAKMSSTGFAVRKRISAAWDSFSTAPI